MQKYRVWITCIFLFLSFYPLVSVENKWESNLNSFFTEEKITYLEQLRFYTYLYAAQNQGVNQGEAVQNIITKRLVKYFFPDFSDFPSFSYTYIAQHRAEKILNPFLTRIKAEDKSEKKFKSKCWLKQIPKPIAQVAHWKSWTSPLPMPPAPLSLKDEEGWKEQFKQLRKMQFKMTEQQYEKMSEWIGFRGFFGHWRELANEYMEEHDIPQNKIYFIRACLMKGMYDGIIAEMTAKYTYCIPRPYMMDPTFKPLTVEIQSPSYPSGHAIQGSIFATIMSYFFPENKANWERIEKESGEVRLWAGMHFPEDVVQGHKLGRAIADKILEH